MAESKQMDGTTLKPPKVRLRHSGVSAPRPESQEDPIRTQHHKVADLERVDLIAAIEQMDQAIVITDAAANIRYINPSFIRITGSEEALGQSASQLKSGAQDPVFYVELWATILAGRIWKGSLINRRKNGTLYTKDMTLPPSWTR